MVDNFLNNLKFERRYSAHTLTAYKTDLFQFSSYLLNAYDFEAPEKAAPIHIRSYLAQLIDQGITSRSVQRKMISLRSFYKFLMQENVITTSPMVKITLPKSGSRLPSYIEEKDMRKTNVMPSPEDEFSTIRNHLIIQMLYQTGMRLSELKTLKTDDINLNKCELKVMGKRKKERIIPFTEDLKIIIEAFQKQKNTLPASNSIFLLVLNNGKPVYDKFIYRVVTSALDLITTAEKKSPHVLRHTYATHLMNHGADINAIKELLGHSSLAATQIYTHNSIEKLKEAHRNSHPRA